MFNIKSMKTLGSCLFLIILCFGIISSVHAEDLGNDKDITYKKLNKSITIGPKTLGGLKEAIKIAKTNDTIYLKNGVYTGKNNRKIYINKNISIEGLGSKVTINAQGKNRIFFIKKSKVSIKNLKFINGYTNGSGGAIYSKKSSLNVNKCSFTSNQAKNIANDSQISMRGGAIYIEGGSLNVKNSVFTNNQGDEGGAIFYSSQNGHLIVNKCIFSNNNAKIRGGAIDSYANSTINNSVFKNNKAKFNGGGINSEDSTTNNCTFTNNQAKYGGAIYSRESTINQSIFKNNQANNGGAICSENTSINTCLFKNNQGRFGGAIHDLDNSAVEKCTFKNNQAKLDGGAIYELGQTIRIMYDTINSSGTITIISNLKVNNSIFTNNQANRNGGAILSKCPSIINKSTFNNNQAKQNGGAIYSKAKSINISNSRFINNVAAKVYNAIFTKGTLTIENLTVSPKEGTKVKK